MRGWQSWGWLRTCSASGMLARYKRCDRELSEGQNLTMQVHPRRRKVRSSRRRGGGEMSGGAPFAAGLAAIGTCARRAGVCFKQWGGVGLKAPPHRECMCRSIHPAPPAAPRRAASHSTVTVHTQIHSEVALEQQRRLLRLLALLPLRQRVVGRRARALPAARPRHGHGQHDEEGEEYNQRHRHVLGRRRG